MIYLPKNIHYISWILCWKKILKVLFDLMQMFVRSLPIRCVQMLPVSEWILNIDLKHSKTEFSWGLWCLCKNSLSLRYDGKASWWTSLLVHASLSAYFCWGCLRPCAFFSLLFLCMAKATETKCTFQSQMCIAFVHLKFTCHVYNRYWRKCNAQNISVETLDNHYYFI